MTLAGIAPPSTLNVVPGLQNKTAIVPWPSLDWNSTDWSVRIGSTAVPSSAVMDLATQAAVDAKIPIIDSYATNSSYNYQFHGPSVSCSTANATQQADFDYYINQASNSSSSFLTEQLFKAGPTNSSTMVYWSAFAPTLGPTGWLNFLTVLPSQTPTDEYNNWPVELPENYTTKLPGYNPRTVDEGQGNYEAGAPLTLWVQTANDSLICTMGNATYDINFNYINSAQSISHNAIGDIEPIAIPFLPAKDLEPRIYAYAGVFIAFTSMLSGNVTTITGHDQFAAAATNDYSDVNEPLRIFQWDSSSNILRTGLTGCDDFRDNFWADHPIATSYILNSSTTSKFVTVIPDDYAGNVTNSVTFKDPSLCRNRTLARAIEDLAHNITISMLATGFTQGNSTFINATTWMAHNIYEYSPRNLFISYGIAIFLTLIVVAIGLWALRINGVSHGMGFSTFVAATRNPRLDALCEGESLGGLPLEKRLGRVRLKFGVIAEEGKRVASGNGHVGFGVEEEVMHLEKGGTYT